MRKALLALALLGSACATAKTEQRPESQAQAESASPPGKSEAPPPPTSPNATAIAPLSTGKQTVKGGESFGLRGGANVQVAKVVYVNQPCPQGVQCVTSGIIRSVEFKVSHNAPEKLATVTMGNQQVVEGVQLRVFEVTEGPKAEIEASLPVGASATP